MLCVDVPPLCKDQQNYIHTYILKYLQEAPLQQHTTYLYMRQYMQSITMPGIQKLTELDMSAYALLTTNEH